MALTFTKTITGVYPAFNNSYLVFTTDDAPVKAEITVNSPSDLFSSPFVIYPNSDGYFLFNLKEIAKIAFDSDRFEFSEIPSDGWVSCLPSVFASLELDFLVYTDAGSEESTQTFDFYRGAHQVTDDYFDLIYLKRTETNSTLSLDYWEGFPFDVQFNDMAAGDSIQVKNLITGATSTALSVPDTVDSSSAFSLCLDDASRNWTSSNFLNLADTDNRLEIWKNGSFLSNLNITKKTDCKGVYLRWVNSKGGTSYQLFDEYYKETISGSSYGLVSRNDFANADDLTSNYVDLGKAGSKTRTLKTIVKKNKLINIEDLKLSPNIEVYKAEEAFTPAGWYGVTVEGSHSVETKRGYLELSVSLDMPDLITLSI